MSGQQATNSLFSSEFNYGDPYQYDGDDALTTFLFHRADSKMLVAIDLLAFSSETKDRYWCRKQVFVAENNELVAITDIHEGREENWNCIVTIDK